MGCYHSGREGPWAGVQGREVPIRHSQTNFDIALIHGEGAQVERRQVARESLLSPRHGAAHI